MAKYNVLISEEVTYKYEIDNDDKKTARNIAMDLHECDAELSKAISIDRCEIINIEAIKDD